MGSSAATMQLLVATLWVMSSMTSCAGSVSNPMTYDDESWNLDRHYRRAVSQGDLAPQGLAHGPDVRNLQWSARRTCNAPVPRKTRHDTTDDLLPQRSTCPWNWVINYDPRREPSTLLVARCACVNCISGGSERNQCRPLHYFRSVLYNKGTARERRVLYRLAVGCTCERHSAS